MSDQVIIEVGFDPFKIKLIKTVSLGPGGDRYIYIVQTLAYGKEYQEMFTDYNLATSCFNKTVQQMTQLSDGFTDSQMQQLTYWGGLAFFFGIMAGIGLVYLIKMVFP